MSNKFTKENLENIENRFSNETGVKFQKHNHRFITAPAKIGLVCACCALTCAGVFATDSGQTIIEKLFFNKPVASEEISYGFKEPSKKSVAPDKNDQSMQGELQGDYSLVTDPGHMGIDIVAEKGTPVYPVLAGVVMESGFEAARGNYIILKHAENYTSTYAHLEEIMVDNEQKVDINTQIGTVGATGMSTGPHLHLEMTQNGELIDPTSFIYPNYKDYFELDN